MSDDTALSLYHLCHHLCGYQLKCYLISRLVSFLTASDDSGPNSQSSSTGDRLAQKSKVADEAQVVSGSRLRVHANSL